ncbi:hypothetical protein Tco_1297730 [Tanacetum coccineum]
MKMMPHEAFAYCYGEGNVELRESYQPHTRGQLYYACPLSKPQKNDFGCKLFYGKRNESVYRPLHLEIQRLQFLLQDFQHLQMILRDLLEMQCAQTTSS